VTPVWSLAEEGRYLRYGLSFIPADSVTGDVAALMREAGTGERSFLRCVLLPLRR
jgi:hypothetical protein